MAAVGSLAATAVDASALDWRRDAAWQGLWRCWTAAFVHLSPMHLAGNLAGVAVVAWWGWRARVGTAAALAWLAVWPLVHAALWLRASPARYGGLSGVLHAAVAIAAVHLCVAGRGRDRAVGAAVLAGLVVKIVLEAPWGPAVQVSMGIDIPVVPGAHASGALLGIGGGLVAAACARAAGRSTA